MKTLILSTAVAAALGAFALTPATAAGMMNAPVAASAVTSDVDCRMIEKRVTRNGVTRITKTRECSNDRSMRRDDYRDRDRFSDRRDRDRRDYRDDRRPGITLQLPR